MRTTIFGFILYAASACAAIGAERPNVVVIIADDLGYADMAFLPRAPEDVKRFGTPGFDRLARTGTYFSNAYATSPICSPSRTGLITGRYQQRWGNYWFNEGGLPMDQLTIPEALGQAGYVAAKVGKTHLNGGPKEFPTEHGFDRFLGFMHHTWDYIRLSHKDVEAYEAREGFNGFANQIIGPLLKADRKGASRQEAASVSYEDDFTTRIFTDEAVRFIQEDKGAKPFYLHVAYNAVHHPTYVVDERWAEKTGARYVPWDRDAKEWKFPYWEPSRESNAVFHKNWGHMGEIDKEGRRCYLSNLLALDHGVSKILDALEESGQRENTLVVFLSDNGGTINTYANNAPLSGFKYMFGEGGIRIPMLVSMPGKLPEGVVNDTALVSTLDLFPTAMELAGVEAPVNLDGKSLLPVLIKQRATQHEWLAWAENRDKWVIRKGPWKLVNNVHWVHRDFKLSENGDAVDSGQYEYPDGIGLYNLEEDIGETTSLADRHPELVQELHALRDRWNAQMEDPRKSVKGR